ncbi:MAG: IS607 family element RNA-guided endonuclease TnpB, partial [Actinomycetota bacterium]|nr:IS607 family element RNA-guided endonuclease TnpB [Actinomycetota bacterium]
MTQAYRFALDPTPSQTRALSSHCGGRRFAYNWGLALVKARLDERQRVRSAALTEQLADSEVTRLERTVGVPWTLAGLRRDWNAVKDEVAPWWAQNSKESYSAGLADLAKGLDAFSKSRRGERKGARVGFPRFKGRRRRRQSYRYTTGRFGVSGRCRVQLPRIGHVRTHEPTVKLLRRVENGRARVFSMSVCRENGRWYCSLCCEVSREDRPAVQSESVIGVDVGIKHLAVLSTGELVENPRALSQAQRRLRRYQRKLDRQRRSANPGCYDERGRAIKGKRPIRRSKRMRGTERRVARLHARAGYVRRDALHKLTTALASEHRTIVVEKLNAKGLCRSGNRGLRRALHDASLAEIRRQLAYKALWRGGELIQAPTLFPSSKTCSRCRAVKAKLPLSERTYRCERCGLVLDRDLNAARNLAALASSVAPSGGETINARSRPVTPGVPRTHVRPGRAGQRVDRVARTTPVGKTGTASEQSKA